jgi:hypothetical protein
MKWDDFDSERVQQIICQITGKKVSKDKTPIPLSVIKGSGVIFLWAPVKKSFVKINRGTSVYIVSLQKDDMGRILIYDGFGLLAIDPDELEELGFN